MRGNVLLQRIQLWYLFCPKMTGNKFPLQKILHHDPHLNALNKKYRSKWLWKLSHYFKFGLTNQRGFTKIVIKTFQFENMLKKIILIHIRICGFLVIRGSSGISLKITANIETNQPFIPFIQYKYILAGQTTGRNGLRAGGRCKDRGDGEPDAKMASLRENAAKPMGWGNPTEYGRTHSASSLRRGVPSFGGGGAEPSVTPQTNTANRSPSPHPNPRRCRWKNHLILFFKLLSH